MEMVAHHRRFGVDIEDEPFVFVWLHDDNLDCVLSLTRSIDDSDAFIEVMARDQLWERVSDLKCHVDTTTIHVEIPFGLRKYVSNRDTIVVHLNCTISELHNLVPTFQSIFKGKKGFKVDI